MTITLSDGDFDLWQESGGIYDCVDSAETIQTFPPQLATGHKRLIQLRGICLVIHNYEFHQDLKIKYQSSPPVLEFGFQIVGNRQDRGAGQNFVYGGACEAGTWQEQAGQQILQVDIHLEKPEQFSSLVADEYDQLPSELTQLLVGSEQPSYAQIDMTTGAMQLVLKQLLHCPYQKLTKQIYLESKCLELVALRLEQIAAGEPRPSLNRLVRADDIERIHQAKDIMIANLDRPPSLLELARLVGLNDRKLKQGFRQIFGTTVFGYLHDYRLQQAYQMLVTRQMNVKEAAQAVGYASQSSFNAAFKQKYGRNPKSCQLAGQ